MAPIKSKKERLIPVNPSGKREESLVGLIHDLVRQIPPGRVTSYGAIATVLNIPNPRMVGKAMRSSDSEGNPVPAHRVVNSTGHLSGEHQTDRRRQLEKEGVKLKGDKIIDFRNLFWDPAKEL
ncbi:MAG TPA: MGMT family protein [Puia sp.]|jgi:methylated-DNA-protein-cysteine methyltransferase-like protein